MTSWARSYKAVQQLLPASHPLWGLTFEPNIHTVRKPKLARAQRLHGEELRPPTKSQHQLSDKRGNDLSETSLGLHGFQQTS